MKLQTEIKLKKQDDNQIDYHSKLLLLGSCFSENMGDKFNYFKFQSITNPFGILFHPKAIENLIIRAIRQKEYIEDDVFFHNEQWHCYEAHSKLSHSSKEVLLQNLNQGLQFVNKQITKSTHVIITLGTAWVYSLIESDKIVANCHKVPQKQFNKRLLSVEEIIESLQSIVKVIQSINKEASVVFTVSPVRHIKDGFIENTNSKSHLVTAVHKVTSAKKQQYYFPSYEIMLDELRDYRFYKIDMLHPNEMAVNYIWEKFLHVWMSSEATKTMHKVDNIQKGLLHQPFNKDSLAYKEFLNQIDQKRKTLIRDFPFISF